jgi:hypothetical protein
MYIPKSELKDQGCIKHYRSLYLWYIQRIITQATPLPQYEGELYTNIIGENMVANSLEYENRYPCLVFKKL